MDIISRLTQITRAHFARANTIRRRILCLHNKCLFTQYRTLHFRSDAIIQSNLTLFRSFLFIVLKNFLLTFSSDGLSLSRQAGSTGGFGALPRKSPFPYSNGGHLFQPSSDSSSAVVGGPPTWGFITFAYSLKNFYLYHSLQE